MHDRPHQFTTTTTDVKQQPVLVHTYIHTYSTHIQIHIHTAKETATVILESEAAYQRQTERARAF